jgi:hypothetical protein
VKQRRQRCTRHWLHATHGRGTCVPPGECGSRAPARKPELAWARQSLCATRVTGRHSRADRGTRPDIVEGLGSTSSHHRQLALGTVVGGSGQIATIATVLVCPRPRPRPRPASVRSTHPAHDSPSGHNGASSSKKSPSSSRSSRLSPSPSASASAAEAPLPGSRSGGPSAGRAPRNRQIEK